MCVTIIHYCPEEEEIPAMTATTGVQALGEGCHYDTMTRMTAMVTTMQDRLQERFPTKRPTTSLDYVISFPQSCFRVVVLLLNISISCHECLVAVGALLERHLGLRSSCCLEN